MALRVEDVVDGGMHAEETLSGSSRFEPLHLALSSPYRRMRVLRLPAATASPELPGELVPGLGDQMLLQARQATLRGAHEIVHRRVGRASRRAPLRSERRGPSAIRDALCRIVS